MATNENKNSLMRIKNIIILITASTRGSSTSLVPIILIRFQEKQNNNLS